jgi:dUTP pyrophosphatase
METTKFGQVLTGFRERLDKSSEELRARLKEARRLAARIFVKKLDPRSLVPVRKTPDAACLDLAPIEGGVLTPGEAKRFKTGLAIALPPGTVGRIVSRSSRFFEGFYIDGTLDPDYRGDVSLQIRNVSDRALAVVAGERYAQLLVLRFHRGEVVEVEELSKTERGEGGFGSTGK